MGKLSSLHHQIQDSINNAISTSERTYFSLTEKSASFCSKWYQQHNSSIAKACNSLREFNIKSGEKLAAVIAKIEKEPTTEDKVKETIDQAAEATKTLVEKAAEQAAKLNEKAKKVKEDVLA